MAVAGVTGSFRRISVSVETTYTEKDHGPIVGNQHPLPRHTRLKAERELNETEERKKTEIAKLRKITDDRVKLVIDEEKEEAEATQSTFGGKPDDVLIRFLRARKYNSERAYELMRGYVGYRIRYPNVMEAISENKVRHWVQKGQPGFLPSRDSRGRIVMFFRFENWNPVEHPFTKAMQIFVYILNKLLESHETQINGMCIVEDFSGYTMAQVTAVGINEYKQMIDMLQGSFPCRFKGIHCIRQPWHFAKVFNMIKPLLKSKIFERIYVYGDDMDAFYNEFSRTYLPTELGGTGAPYDGVAAANMLFDTKVNDIDEETEL